MRLPATLFHRSRSQVSGASPRALALDVSRRLGSATVSRRLSRSSSMRHSSARAYPGLGAQVRAARRYGRCCGTGQVHGNLGLIRMSRKDMDRAGPDNLLQSPAGPFIWQQKVHSGAKSQKAESRTGAPLVFRPEEFVHRGRTGARRARCLLMFLRCATARGNGLVLKAPPLPSFRLTSGCGLRKAAHRRTAVG